MNATEILRQWTHSVEAIFEQMHAHQAKTLAAVSCGMALCGRCGSGHLAVAVPSLGKPVKASSVRRRVERMLSNPRLKVSKACGLLARHILAHWSGRSLLLILDETPNGQDLRCMRISVGYRKRAVPLMWYCYRTDAPPLPMPKLIWTLLNRAARCLPPGVEVTFLTDRGLSWPSVLDCCAYLGWHYVLRMQHATRIVLDDGSEKPVDQLAPRPGSTWLGCGKVFKKSGWRQGNVVAHWQKGCKEPWLLLSDLPASFARCRNYCKRNWCEQTHRDDKSHGFNWQQSRVRNPAHAHRLLLAIALATLLAISLGTWVLKRGWRRVLESTRERRLSIFQLGLRWLSSAVNQNRPVSCAIYLQPP
jgi:hypothetical protein